MKSKPLLITLVVVVVSIPVFGQYQVRNVSPSETQSSITVVHGPHRVSAPNLKNRKNRLLVSISGTGGRAEEFDRFDSVASMAGYHTISLDYKNEVITTVCLTSTDSTCYDSFRKEIVFGTPVSDKVKVDSTNSIYHRLYRLLEFLSTHFPQEGWNAFLIDKKINWSNITAVGHSQGAGHVAFLGKQFRLDKVIILAGPQDYLDHFKRPAPWISGKSKTPPDRYFALLHPKDPFGFDRQLASCLRLSSTTVGDTLTADAQRLKHASGHILITHIGNDSPHGSAMLPEQAEVWKYLLK